MLGCSLLDAIHFTTNHSERARLIHQLASLLRFEIERVTKKQRPSKELLKDTGDYTLILASSSVARELCSISKGPPLLVEPAGGTLAYLARGALDRDDGGLLHASLQMLMGREKTQAPLEIIELPGRRTRLLDFVEAGGYSTLLQLLGLVPSHWCPAEDVHPLLRGFNRLSLGLFPTSDDLSLCLDCLVAKALVSLVCCMHASGLSADLCIVLRDEPFAAPALEACLAIMSPSARFHLEERETASLTVLHLSHLIELHSKDEGSPMLLCLQRQILESAPALLDAILETRSSVSLTCNILTALTSLLQTPQPAEFAHLLHLILRACRKFVEPRMSRSVLHGCVNVMAAIVVSNSGLCEAHARQMTAGADLTWAALLIAQHEQTSEPPPNGLEAMRRLTSCLDGQYGREMKLVVEGGEKGPLFSGEGADEARELALRLGWIKPATKAEEMRLEEMRCEAEETCKEISFCSNPACRIDALTCALKKCARCGIAHYCSAGCQKVDWRRHKKLCKQSAEGAQ